MSNAHIEEQDGSDHGNTGKPARPDPSPNGKDCEVHGQHGGVNEDHCEATPTTTTTTTVTPTTTSTGPSPVSTTTTTATGSPSTPTTETSVTSGPTSTLTGGPAVATVAASPVSIRELPQTGMAGDLAPFGLALVLLGVALRRAVRR